MSIAKAIITMKQAYFRYGIKCFIFHNGHTWQIAKHRIIK